MKRLRLWLEFSRPFTLVAPALGFASGAVTAAGAAPREPLTPALWLYPLVGLTMAAVLNAASNGLNQIYDFEIDRVELHQALHRELLQIVRIVAAENFLPQPA